MPIHTFWNVSQNVISDLVILTKRFNDGVEFPMLVIIVVIKSILDFINVVQVYVTYRFTIQNFLFQEELFSFLLLVIAKNKHFKVWDSHGLSFDNKFT